jgi:hypothetical protein
MAENENQQYMQNFWDNDYLRKGTTKVEESVSINIHLTSKI